MADKKDYTEEHTQTFLKKLAEIEELKKGNRDKDTLSKIINNILLPFEKQCRVSEDLATTSKVALLVLTLCYSDFKNFEMLLESTEILVKRRGQLQQVVKDIVSKTMEFCGITDQDGILRSLDSETADINAFVNKKATWFSEEQTLSLLKTLLTLTEGKIYVERERTVVVYCVSKLFEEKGDFSEACKMIQDVQIETFTYLSGEEKTIFLINQIRLLVKVKDYSKALIVANKATKKILNKKKNVLIKIKFCKLMAHYWSLVRNWLKVAMFYSELYQTYLAIQNAVDKGIIKAKKGESDDDDDSAMDVETESANNLNGTQKGKKEKEEEEEEELSEEERQKKIDNTYPLNKDQANAMRGETMECLEQLVLFTAMAPYSCEQCSLLGKALKERSIEDSKEWKDFAELFHKSEIISWSRGIVKKYKALLAKKSALFAAESFEEGIAFKNDNEVVTPNVWRDLRSRVIEHNLNVIAVCYTRITMDRLKDLLEVSSIDEAEKAVRDQVTSPYLDEHIYAKIDRPAGIVRFAKPKNVNDLLDGWSAQLNDLVNLVDETCHLIQREYTK